MILEYWRQQMSWSTTPFDLKSISSVVLDELETADYKYGNWAFNVSAVPSLTHNRLQGEVTRLLGISQLERLMAAGIPAAVSIQWETGHLKGAPLEQSDGHVVVVRGVSPDTLAGPCSPAPIACSQKVAYERAEFDAAWAKKRRTTYLIRPLGVPLPEVPEGGVW
jgi:hypothetical protein